MLIVEAAAGVSVPSVGRRDGAATGAAGSSPGSGAMFLCSPATEAALVEMAAAVDALAASGGESDVAIPEPVGSAAAPAAHVPATSPPPPPAVATEGGRGSCAVAAPDAREDEWAPPHGMVNTGFMTARGARVAVSGAAMHKATEMLSAAALAPSLSGPAAADSGADLRAPSSGVGTDRKRKHAGAPAGGGADALGTGGGGRDGNDAVGGGGAARAPKVARGAGLDEINGSLEDDDGAFGAALAAMGDELDPVSVPRRAPAGGRGGEDEGGGGQLPPARQEQPSSGFKTGLGRAVKISDAAIARAKQFLGDDGGDGGGSAAADGGRFARPREGVLGGPSRAHTTSACHADQEVGAGGGGGMHNRIVAGDRVTSLSAEAAGGHSDMPPPAACWNSNLPIGSGGGGGAIVHGAPAVASRPTVLERDAGARGGDGGGVGAALVSRPPVRCVGTVARATGGRWSPVLDGAGPRSGSGGGGEGPAAQSGVAGPGAGSGGAGRKRPRDGCLATAARPLPPLQQQQPPVAGGAELSRKLFTTPMTAGPHAPLPGGGGARRPTTAFKSPAVVRPPAHRASPLAAATVARAVPAPLVSPGVVPTVLQFGGGAARPSSESVRVIAALSAGTALALRFVTDGVALEAPDAPAAARGCLSFGPREAAGALLAMGAALSQLSVQWIANHWRWICWKLAARERRDPEGCGGLLNFAEVVRQLHWRYVRELVHARRPALRKMLARDTSCAAYMVLCVADVRTAGGRASDPAELTLTDGWYAEQPPCHGCSAHGLMRVV